MNTEKNIDRLKASIATLVLTFGVGVGNANAMLESFEWWLIGDDPGAATRNAIAIDMNTDVQGLPNLKSPELQQWFQTASPQAAVGVFGIGNNNSTLANFVIFTSVHPEDEPGRPLGAGQLNNALLKGQDYIRRFNDGGSDILLADSASAPGFPTDFGDSWGGNTSGNFRSMVPVFPSVSGAGGETPQEVLLNLYMFGLNSTGTDGAAPEPLGALIVDTAEGSIGPVPVPAAVWLFGSALVGLFGLRRRPTL